MDFSSNNSFTTFALRHGHNLSELLSLKIPYVLDWTSIEQRGLSSPGIYAKEDTKYQQRETQGSFLFTSSTSAIPLYPASTIIPFISQATSTVLQWIDGINTNNSLTEISSYSSWGDWIGNLSATCWGFTEGLPFTPLNSVSTNNNNANHSLLSKCWGFLRDSNQKEDANVFQMQKQRTTRPSRLVHFILTSRLFISLSSSAISLDNPLLAPLTPPWSIAVQSKKENKPIPFWSISIDGSFFRQLNIHSFSFLWNLNKYLSKFVLVMRLEQEGSQSIHLLANMYTNRTVSSLDGNEREAIRLEQNSDHVDTVGSGTDNLIDQTSEKPLRPSHNLRSLHSNHIIRKVDIGLGILRTSPLNSSTEKRNSKRSSAPPILHVGSSIYLFRHSLLYAQADVLRRITLALLYEKMNLRNNSQQKGFVDELCLAMRIRLNTITWKHTAVESGITWNRFFLTDEEKTHDLSDSNSFERVELPRLSLKFALSSKRLGLGVECNHLLKLVRSLRWSVSLPFAIPSLIRNWFIIIVQDYADQLNIKLALGMEWNWFKQCNGFISISI